MQTPDGVFKKKHYRAVMNSDGGAKSFKLKIAHKLTPDHLNPAFFQKMHVNKAFDVSIFSKIKFDISITTSSLVQFCLGVFTKSGNCDGNL